MNIFNRVIRSVSDFQFSNHFVKEKMSKSIGLLFFGYILFILVFGIYVVMSVNPMLNDLGNAFNDSLSDVPDFTLFNGEFSFADDRTYYEKNLDGMFIAVDLENRYDISHYKAYDNFIVYKDRAIYINSDVPTPMEGMQTPITKESLNNLFDIIIPMIYIGLAIAAVLGVAFMFVLSAVNWVIAIIINNVIRKELSSAELYKVTVHAMVLPGVVMLINWIVPFTIPMFYVIYLGLTAFYSYMFIKNYEEEDIDLHAIYE